MFYEDVPTCRVMSGLAFALTLLAPSPLDTCNYDADAMLALPEQDFDQSMAGWRSLDVKGCYLHAAQILGLYRRQHNSENYLLAWHEGQMLAYYGDNDKAIELFRAAKRPEVNIVDAAWNIYVYGSIAFLQGNQSDLVDLRDRLSVLPRPLTVKVRRPDGQLADIDFPAEISWPPNLDALNSLMACFGRSYKEAYACKSARFDR